MYKGYNPVHEAYNIGTADRPSYAILSGISFNTSGGSLADKLTEDDDNDGQVDILDSGNVAQIYTWGLGDAGQCSSPCGAGTAVADTLCVDRGGRVVDDSFCVDMERPLAVVACSGSCRDMGNLDGDWVSYSTGKPLSRPADGWYASSRQTKKLQQASRVMVLKDSMDREHAGWRVAIDTWGLDVHRLPYGNYKISFEVDGCATSGSVNWSVTAKKNGAYGVFAIHREGTGRGVKTMYGTGNLGSLTIMIFCSNANIYWPQQAFIGNISITKL